ncbi:MAG: S8 family serine peptidase [Pedobacter sp.]|nr:S8 family serine peptidase [Pedobacter sp.]
MKTIKTMPRLLPLLACLLPVAGLAYTPDAEYNSQPGLAAIKAGAAYDLGITGAGIRIGIVDSGISPLHEAFAGAIAAGYNFRTGSDLLDDYGIGHGSHISGIAAARRDGSGMMGVAYGAELVVAATDFSSGELSAGINFALSNGARIINNSWGYGGSTVLDFSAESISATYPDLLDALHNAVAADAIVVFANGNDALQQPQVMGGLPYYFPELQRNFITVVASTNDAKYFSPYSNRCGVAAAWCVAAPGGYGGYDTGENAPDSSTTSGYTNRYGTSEATAMVSGSLALLAERFAYMTGELLVGVLLTTAAHGTDTVLSTIYGRGEVDIAKAMKGPAALEFDYDVNVTVDDSWSNNIMGTGALIKRGSSTLTLSGSNTFSGGVTVADGQLRISADSNLGASTADFTLSGGVLEISNDVSLARSISVTGTAGGVDTGTFRLTLTGNLTGDGVLEKNGSGTLSLQGSSDFSGTTYILAGTVETSAAHFSGDVVDDATLLFAQDVNGVFSGAISGGGSLIKAGTADLHLTGSNSFTGEISVQAGSLSGDSAALNADIINDATVIFTQDIDGEYAAAMSGAGRLIKSGSGRLHLAGSNSYSGGTEISAGVLDGDANSLQGDFSGAGTLAFNQSGIGNFNGSLHDLAALEKTGTGTLYLQSAGNSAVTTTVKNGFLVLPAGLASNVVVAGGALAAPGGVQGSLEVDDGGKLLAGGDAGALQVDGQLTVKAGAQLALQLSSTGSTPLLNVTGPVQLQGGTVLVNASAAPVLARYVLLKSDSSLQGQFDALSTSPSLRAFLRYDENSAALVLSRSDALFSSRANDRNSVAAAAALEEELASGFYSDSFAASVNALAAAAPTALDALSGEVVADTGPALTRLLDGVLWSALAAQQSPVLSSLGFSAVPRFSYTAPASASGPRAWIYGNGRRSKVDGVDAAGYDYDQSLLVAGADAALGAGLRLGFMLSQGSQSLSRDGSSDTADSDVLAAGIYLRHDSERVALVSALTAGHADTESRRSLPMGGEAVAESSTRLLALDLLMRYRWLQRSSWQLNPLLALNWTQLDTPAFSESAPGMLGLSYAYSTQQSQIISAGAELLPAAAILPENFSCQASLLWRHDFSDEDDYAVAASYSQLPGSGFEIRPALAGSDTARLALGLAYGFDSGAQLGLQGMLEAGSGFSSAGLTLGLDWRW